MYTAPWTEEEDDAIYKHYSKHGALWDGWKVILPLRSQKAIAMRAGRIGVARKYRSKRSKPMNVTQQVVFGFLEDGLAPSEIDDLKGWKRGTSHDAIIELWAARKEQEDE